MEDICSQRKKYANKLSEIKNTLVTKIFNYLWNPLSTSNFIIYKYLSEIITTRGGVGCTGEYEHGLACMYQMPYTTSIAGEWMKMHSAPDFICKAMYNYSVKSPPISLITFSTLINMSGKNKKNKNP